LTDSLLGDLAAAGLTECLPPAHAPTERGPAVGSSLLARRDLAGEVVPPGPLPPQEQRPLAGQEAPVPAVASAPSPPRNCPGETRKTTGRRRAAGNLIAALRTRSGRGLCRLLSDQPAAGRLWPSSGQARAKLGASSRSSGQFRASSGLQARGKEIAQARRCCHCTVRPSCPATIP
jgi:hypothetical protein